jgi:hypothetical protein
VGDTRSQIGDARREWLGGLLESELDALMRDPSREHDLRLEAYQEMVYREKRDGDGVMASKAYWRDCRFVGHSRLRSAWLLVRHWRVWS